MKLKEKWKKNSLTKKILFPTTIIMLLQIILILLIISMGPIYSSLNEGSVSEYGSGVDLRSSYIQNTMVKNWGAIESDSTTINEKVQSFLKEQNCTIDSVLNDVNMQNNVLDYLKDDIKVLLRRNQVTDAFIVLDSQQSESEKKGIALRDNVPDFNNNGNTDIVIEVAPYAIRQYYSALKFDTSILVEDYFNLHDIQDSSFYYNPLNQAKINETNDSSYLGYWSTKFGFHGTDNISYTEPLIIDEKVYGVIGVGISKAYYKKLIASFNSNEYKIDNLSIIEWKENELNQYELVCNNYSNNLLNNLKIENMDNTEFDKLYLVKSKDGKSSYYVFRSKIQLYSENTPFEEECWYTVGIISKEALFGKNKKTLQDIIIVSIIGLFIAILVEILICFFILKPIRVLTSKINEDKTYNAKFNKVNVYEIDSLLNKLEVYVQKSLELPNKLNRVIELADVKIGTFEYNQENGIVTVTTMFYNLLTVNDAKVEIPIEEFKEKLKFIKRYMIEEKEGEYQYYFPSVSSYILLKIVQISTGYIGVARDNTKEMNDKISIASERDLDILTGLLNRRGFQNRVERLFQLPLKNTMLIMIDIDNLKYINDKYGHDFGDKYIIRAAQIMNQYSGEKVIVSHLSGDEFLLLLHNFDSKEEIKKLVERFKWDIDHSNFELYGENMTVKLSAGLAFYDETTTCYDELRKHADFAMYEVKSTTKNGFNYFDKDRYNEKLLNLKLCEQLNVTIEKEMVDYYFQPIVSIQTGIVLGYEALMRPSSPYFKTPMDLLSVAKKNKMLSKVEYLTFFCATKKFVSQNSDKLLFINSLSSQILGDDAYYNYLDKYKSIMKNKLVIELTEEESIIPEILEKKRNFITNMNALFAIDDYGTGYNTVSMLVNFDPKFVKIEGSFVRGIDKDDKKYKLTSSIVEYCKENNIKVIAESVETLEEFITVKKIGVDYVQGYFLAKPQGSITKEEENSIKELVENIRKKDL